MPVRYSSGSVLALFCAIAVYMTLSLAGIHYGLPQENHPLSYNTDETTWLEALASIRPSEGRFNPHPKFTHPTFYLEAYGVAVGVLAKAHWITVGQS